MKQFWNTKINPIVGYPIPSISRDKMFDKQRRGVAAKGCKVTAYINREN